MVPSPSSIIELSPFGGSDLGAVKGEQNGRSGKNQLDMGRGVSCGGGQSSLGYLFGSNEAPKPVRENAAAPSETKPVAVNKEPPVKPNAAYPQPAHLSKQIPAGINSSATITNNYYRADGQNTGNFLTDRPWTKVHAAPGGGSSLGYLFGGGSN